MITIFNRKELTITFSMEQLSTIRTALSFHHIDYTIKTINRNSPTLFNDTRAQFGTLGQNMNTAYEYIIYVHKDNYETAIAYV